MKHKAWAIDLGGGELYTIRRNGKPEIYDTRQAARRVVRERLNQARVVRVEVTVEVVG